MSYSDLLNTPGSSDPRASVAASNKDETIIDDVRNPLAPADPAPSLQGSTQIVVNLLSHHENIRVYYYRPGTRRHPQKIQETPHTIPLENVQERNHPLPIWSLVKCMAEHIRNSITDCLPRRHRLGSPSYQPPIITVLIPNLDITEQEKYSIFNDVMKPLKSPVVWFSASQAFSCTLRSDKYYTVNKSAVILYTAARDMDIGLYASRTPNFLCKEVLSGKSIPHGLCLIADELENFL